MKPHCEKCNHRIECLANEYYRNEAVDIIINIYIDGDQVDEHQFTVHLCQGEYEAVLKEKFWNPIYKFEDENREKCRMEEKQCRKK